MLYFIIVASEASDPTFKTIHIGFHNVPHSFLIEIVGGKFFGAIPTAIPTAIPIPIPTAIFGGTSGCNKSVNYFPINEKICI